MINDYPQSVLTELDRGLDAEIAAGLEHRLGELLGPIWDRLGPMHVENTFAFLPDDQRAEAEQLWAALPPF